jgi:hypothetical protein
MTSQIIELLGGILFLFVAITGGGFDVKEIKMSKIPVWGRLASATLGLTFIGIFMWGGFQFSPPPVNSESSRQEHACRRPRDLPAVAAGNRSEAEIRNFLTSEGFFNITTEPAAVPGAPQGVVVGQTPSPGTILCPRDLVTIKVAR